MSLPVKIREQRNTDSNHDRNLEKGLKDSHGGQRSD